ncbi:uncharacterized protein FTOL_02870 [Fusarium torulosum]|uniref:Uncharacterized protein n=1 Tax=Fusarium torulosum TaxID=33205 RepID=A0AAE8SF15_9HYPO|nr:uncharacterized protein FTOL_02870 [Fusarium torulosum]
MVAIAIGNSPTDAEKDEACAQQRTGDANTRWLENLSRRVYEVTMAIAPAEHIVAEVLWGRL